MARTPQDEKLTITQLVEQNPIKEGDTWYPVELRWWKEWKEYTGYGDDEKGTGHKPSEIVNEDLADEEYPIKLKSGMVENYNFKMVHSTVWEKFIDWYKGGPAFPRKVISRGQFQGEVVEMYPKLVLVTACGEDGEPNKEDVTPTLISSKGCLEEVLTSAKEKADGEYRLFLHSVDDEKNELWTLAGPAQLNTDMETQFEIIDVVKVMLEKKPENGDWKREVIEKDWKDFEVGQKIDCQDKMEKWYECVIRDVKETKILIHYVGWPAKWDEWLNIEDDKERYAQLRTHTTGPYVPKAERSFTGYGGGWSMASNEEGECIENGIVGMRNLGNTCFMNSTLQCLQSTGCLLDYWLKDQYKGEINKQNPLGWQGKIAEEYGKLMKDIWCGKYRVVVPRGLKQAVGEFAPRFSGYNQQDSSEFLSFLLDGLHEDLNRCLEKPYTETIESNGRADDVVANEAWETHLKRHNSIIVDTFQGQLKSRVVCPDCAHVSVTFDPYMFLSVPFPTVQSKVIEVTVLSANPNQKMKVIGCKVPKMGCVLNLKEAISKMTNIPMQRLIVGDMWNGRVYKFLNNNFLIGDIRASDTIYCWEVLSLDKEAKQQENERNREWDVVQLLMCTTEEESVSWMQGTRLSTTSIGIPLPLILPRSREMPGNELRKRIRESVAGFIKEEGKRAGEEPFVMRILDYGARTAKEEIPDSNEMVDIERVPFGVDWINPDMYRKDRIKEPEVDASAPSAQRENGNDRRGRGKKKQAIQLDQCIDMYTQEEKLTKENAWRCPKCKDFKQANKKIDLYSVPKILIIHLKRFVFSRMYRDKINELVNFPMVGLDLSKWVLKDMGKKPIYDLYAVSNHMGGLGGGHYNAYAMNEKSKKWYDLDDSSASLANPDRVVSSAAYVLYYRLRE